jgi:hypothetical protein
VLRASIFSINTPRSANVAELMSTQKAQWLICDTRTVTNERSAGDSGDERRSRAP